MINYTINIENFAFGGDGVGHLPDGRICFVRGGVPGDHVEIELVQDKKKFARGRLVKLITPSPDRLSPSCPVQDCCPGCAYRAVPYAMELAAKQAQFVHFLTRGNFVPPDRIQPPFGAPQVDGQRNRLKLACAAGQTGLRGEDNVTLIPITQCALAQSEINAQLQELQKQHQIPETGALYFRAGVDKVAHFTEQNIPRTTIRDYLPDFGEFEVPLGSFFQTNRQVGAELVRRVNALLADIQPRHLLELYCGVGLFSILAAQAHPALRCTGCEIDAAAIHAAKHNAQHHQVADRCRFCASDAGKFLRGIQSLKNSVILIDPPRTGLAVEAAQLLNKQEARHLIYISCAPDTLRRDLERLTNFEVETSALLDMFPRTAHFESITLLRKKELTL